MTACPRIAARSGPQAAGYDSFVVPDNLGYPGASDARYPYTPDGDNSFLEGKPFLEPFSVIPAMGAVTQRLRFTTLVVKLPVRLPYIVAKQSTSIAGLTQNRFALDGFSADGVRRLEDLGVTDVIVGFRNVYQQGPDSQPLDEKIDALNRFADNVISAVR